MEIVVYHNVDEAGRACARTTLTESRPDSGEAYRYGRRAVDVSQATAACSS
jgi:hypothetical protein